MEVLILFALGWLFLGRGPSEGTWTIDETDTGLDVDGNKLVWKIYRKGANYTAVWGDPAGFRPFQGGREYGSKEDLIYELFEAINRGDVKAAA